jgi:hypothetical protein
MHRSISTRTIEREIKIELFEIINKIRLHHISRDELINSFYNTYLIKVPMWKHNGYINVYNILLETMEYHTSKIDPMYKKIDSILDKILYIIPKLDNQINLLIQSSGMFKHPEVVKMLI